MDSSFRWLVVFSLSFTFIWSYNSDFELGKTIYFVFYPPLFYLLGGYFIDKSINFNSIIKILLILIIAYSVIYLSNTIYDTINYGLINPLRSVGINDDSLLGAKFQQVRASLAIAGVGLFFVPTVNSIEKKIKYFFLLLSFLGLFATIHYVNRTGLALALFSVLIVSFKIIKKRSVLVGMFLVGLFLIIITIYLVNLSSVQGFIESYEIRELSDEDNSSTFGGRVVRWYWALNIVSTHPWGDISNSQYGYAHNLWLDVGRLSGIIPFISLIVFTVRSIIRAGKIVINKRLPMFFSCVLITLNLTFLLQSFVEPILESDPIFFCLFVLILGMQNFLLKKINSNLKNHNNLDNKNYLV